MPASHSATPANHTCFCCQFFGGLVGAKANCCHPRLGPIHDAPETGCKRWTFSPSADRAIWTCEDWHVNASRDIPGFNEAPTGQFRRPLSSADIRALYDNPGDTWGDVRAALAALAWEIGRERDFHRRLRVALLALAREPKTPMQTRVYLLRLAQRLLEDPGVREEVERESLLDAIRHRGE